jgi:hypothetical protein
MKTVPPGTPAPSEPRPTPRPTPGPPRVADDYLKVEQVAELLSCHPQTVYNLIYEGAMPAFDIAKPTAKQASLRVARADVHTFMAGRRIQVAA